MGRVKFRPFGTTSKRFCERCGKMTDFEYNKRIGHSECRECGWRKIPRATEAPPVNIFEKKGD
jgi:predicted  nucleic acid-binding Zn-ribbon protein